MVSSLGPAVWSKPYGPARLIYHGERLSRTSTPTTNNRLPPPHTHYHRPPPTLIPSYGLPSTQALVFNLQIPSKHLLLPEHWNWNMYFLPKFLVTAKVYFSKHTFGTNVTITVRIRDEQYARVCDAYVRRCDTGDSNTHLPTRDRLPDSTPRVNL